MMKKILAIMLGVALVLSMAGAVAAANELSGGTSSTSGSGAVEVTYNIGNTYTVIIPDSLTVQKLGVPVKGDVNVTDLVIKADTGRLTVSVKSQYGWKLQTDETGSSKIPYSMTVTLENNEDNFQETNQGQVLGTTTTNSADTAYNILQASMLKRYANASMSVVATYDGSIAGTGIHKDMLTFEVAITEQTQ